METLERGAPVGNRFRRSFRELEYKVLAGTIGFHG
jgi:hypothetical protein